jgi:hypothetical protein
LGTVIIFLIKGVGERKRVWDLQLRRFIWSTQRRFRDENARAGRENILGGTSYAVLFDL